VTLRKVSKLCHQNTKANEKNKEPIFLSLHRPAAVRRHDLNCCVVEREKFICEFDVLLRKWINNSELRASL